MTVVACIVEGHGETRAMPVLLRRLSERRDEFSLQIPAPIRVSRDKFLNRNDELARMVALAAMSAGRDGLVLIVLDADDDCPVELAKSVSDRAAPHLRGAKLAVVIANREYEAWLLAAAPSLAGKRGLPDDLELPERSEDIRDAKGWLSERMVQNSGKSYSPVTDQAALTAALDIDWALGRSRSFRKLDKSVSDFLA